MKPLGWLLGGLALVGVVGGLVWSRHEAEGRPAEPVAVPAGPLGVGALGRVEPAGRIRTLNQPGGLSVTRLDRLLVTEGDRVSAGQVVAEFGDAAQKDAAIIQAEASLAQSRASLARIRAAGRPEEIEAQRARIEALRFAESSLRRDAERAEALVPS
ncbi:MAG: biotin/lipoyl-binding protein, partial [Acetobacteraceae bacterium]